jgi:UDP-glucose 4-epimerase
MNAKILVTGGLGYLGGRISQRIDQELDCRLLIGFNRLRQTNHVWRNEVETIQLDMLSEAALRAACKDVDCIVHLAALNEIQCAANPEAALQINGLGTLKLLQAARQTGVCRVIFFSTAHVYGAPLQGHITEKTNCRPTHPYAITHKVAEDFVLAAHDKGEIEGIVVRLSNAVGAPLDLEVDRWSLLVNDLCRQAVTTQKVALKSNGQQQRDFIAIKDVTKAVVHLLGLAPGSLGDGLYNVGCGKSARVIDLANLVANSYRERTGTHIPVEFVQTGERTDSPELFYDVSKIAQTGFRPTGNIADAVDETLRFCLEAFDRE